MNKAHLWLLVFFAPLLLIDTTITFAFFTSLQPHTVFHVIVIVLIPLAIPLSLTIYIVASKHFLYITKKTILFTTFVTFIGTLSLPLWGIFLYFNPKPMNNTLLSHQFINTVYQDLEHNQYVYSWNKHLSNSGKKTTYTARVAEKQGTTIKGDEYHVHTQNNIPTEKNNFFQPFLRYFLHNSKYNMKKSLAILLVISIMLSFICTGIGIASLWTTNTFLQVIFLINAYGILNIVFNVLTPYLWLLIVLMTSLIIIFFLFIIFRVSYNIDNAATSDEHRLSA